MTNTGKTISRRVSELAEQAGCAADKRKLCKDCKHCAPDRKWWWFCLLLPLVPWFAWQAKSLQYEFARCRLFDCFDGGQYTGARLGDDSFMFCSNARSFDDKCGPRAKLFEAR